MYTHTHTHTHTHFPSGVLKKQTHVSPIFVNAGTYTAPTEHTLILQGRVGGRRGRRR